jgi:selenocysteine lyase/cysteine desulfurase
LEKIATKITSMPQNRKKFLQQLGSGLMLPSLPAWATAEGNNLPNLDIKDFEHDGAADDERFWKKITRKYYDVSDDYINLENGYFGVQPKPVLQSFLENTTRVNKELARFARKEYPGVATAVKKELAAFLNVSDEEIIITRNATEALNIAIQGYPFRPDDEVLISQLDYFSMIETFQMMGKRGQLKINQIELPLLPENEDEIVEAYRRAITPRTRVILLTHVSNINGLIVPVAKISAIAREKGIDTITDSAHALGQIVFNIRELGSDFVGMNLHKWMGNPVGAGVLYIKKERIKEMKALFGDVKAAPEDINKLAHFGTSPFAVIMTIPDSIAFHRLLGTDRISKRLHYLKTIWVNELKKMPEVEMVTPVNMSCAIASFRIKNKNTTDTANYLMNEHRIFTVRRDLGKEGCIRVTPSVYHSADDIKKLVEAVKRMMAD